VPSSETPVTRFESIIIVLRQLLLVAVARGICVFFSERSGRRIRDTIQVFERFHKRYDEWFTRYKWVYRSEVEALSRLIPKGGLGFDVGVGTGRFAAPFRLAVGLDPSGAMVSLAKKKGIEVVCGVGENVPLVAETFDFVLLVTTICFVEDPRATLKEARRVLKDHGSVIVGLVDKNSSLGRSYESGKEASVFYRAATFYSVDQVRDWLAELCFEDLVAYQTIFRPLGRIERLEPIREGYGQGGFVALRATKACN
jgi:SAM-dependent methyltransferase